MLLGRHHQTDGIAGAYLAQELDRAKSLLVEYYRGLGALGSIDRLINTWSCMFHAKTVSSQFKEADDFNR